MDSQTFDRIISHLDTGTPRRRLLAGLLGTSATLLAGVAGSDAKKHKHKGRRRHGPGGGTETVQLCRRNKRRKGFSLIAVGQAAVPAHRRRGAVICPVPPECFAITGCSAGADDVCVLEPDEGAPCNDFYPAAGVCNAAGECEELPIASVG